MSGYIVALYIIATVFVAVYGKQKCPLTYKDCGSGLSKIINVLFSGIDCPSEGAPAVVPRGSTVQVYAEFIPQVSTPTLTASIHACLGFICLPFPLAPTDACQDSNITCPVKSGVQYTYAPVIQIKNYLPWVSACVKWELKSARGEVIGCVKFPVKII